MATEERFPDDQGLVTNITFENVELDGKRRYAISSEVQSFSTYNGKIISLLTWKDKYVHVGLDDDEAIWIAGIGVLDRSRKPPVVYYTNAKFKRLEGRDAVFADGTVLTLAKGVETPPVDTVTTVTIDSKKHLAIDIAWSRR